MFFRLGLKVERRPKSIYTIVGCIFTIAQFYPGTHNYPFASPQAVMPESSSHDAQLRSYAETSLSCLAVEQSQRPFQVKWHWVSALPSRALIGSVVFWNA